MSSEARGRRLGWLIGLLFFAVYSACASRTVSLFGDSAELATAAVTRGVAHPPGYPLLTLLGWLTTHAPGDFDANLHLLSALIHALSLVVFFRLALLWTGSLFSASGGTLILGLSRTFFLGSLYYETFPLNDLLCLCAFWSTARLERAESTSEERTALAALGLSLGLAGGHHQMSVLIVPGILVLLLRSHTRLARHLWWTALWGVLPFVASVLSTWVIALFQEGYGWGQFDDFSGFWRHFNREEYGGNLSPSARAKSWKVGTRQSSFLLTIWDSLGPALLLSALGLWSSLRRTRHLGVSLGLTFLIAGPAFYAINRVGLSTEAYVAWTERFTSLGQLPLCLLSSLGLEELRQRSATSRRWRLLPIVTAAAALAPLLLVVPALNLSQIRLGQEVEEDLILSTEPNSLLLLAGDEASTLGAHACHARKICERRVVLPPSSGWRYRLAHRQAPDWGLPAPSSFSSADEMTLAIIDSQIDSRPVYISPTVFTLRPGIKKHYSLVPQLLLFRLFRKKQVPASFARKASERTLRECRGCNALPISPARPTMFQQSVEAYEFALMNAAAVNSHYGGTKAVTYSLLQRAKAIKLEPWKAPFSKAKSGER